MTHVTLCGLRLGAAFMLIAAGQVDVDELVMLAPVVNGRSYLRELSIVRTIWLEQLPAPLRAVQQRDALLNVLGQVYSATFRDRLKRFDAAAVLKAGTRAPAARTLVFDVHPADSEPMCACIRALGDRPNRGPSTAMGPSCRSRCSRSFPNACSPRWWTGSRLRLARSRRPASRRTPRPIGPTSARAGCCAWRTFMSGRCDSAPTVCSVSSACRRVRPIRTRRC